MKGSVHDFAGVFMVTFGVGGLKKDKHEMVLGYKFSNRPWWRSPLSDLIMPNAWAL